MDKIIHLIDVIQYLLGSRITKVAALKRESDSYMKGRVHPRCWCGSTMVFFMDGAVDIDKEELI